MEGRVLAIDDEENNLKLIKGFLAKSNFEVEVAPDGEQGWELLQKHYDKFDVILLDRMMPNMDGIALTEKIMAHSEIKNIPIIMQTAAAQREQVAEGIAAGVYYYLTKPYDHHLLISIVRSAISDYKEKAKLRQEINQHTNILTLVDSCEFSFKTLTDAKELTAYLVNFFPDPQQVAVGITELLINALEHGNLGITYEEKTKLNASKNWEKEVIRRQLLPENNMKKVYVSYTKDDDEITLTIQDQGKGFSWKQYMELDAERAIHSHGRGIAMANLISFDSVTYNNSGNKVCCKVFLNGQ